MTNELTPSKIKAFNAAIGRFVLEWASTELVIDWLVVILSRKLKLGKLPHEISKKLKFIETEIQKSPLTPTDIQHVQQLVRELKSLVPTRHDYIHGAAYWHSVVASKLVVSSARMLQPPKGERRMPVKITEAILDKTSDRIREIDNQLIDLVKIANHAIT
jgi:hypothetical protein